MKKFFMLLSGVMVSILLLNAAEAKIGGGDIKFKVADVGDVVYSHDVHVNKFGLPCTECHYAVFSRSANNGRDKANMADMQKGKSCGACHNGRRAFDVKNTCDRCHRVTTSAWYDLLPQKHEKHEMQAKF